jgi:hypothetical protein
MLLTDSPSCPDSGRWLRGRCAVSYTCAAQRDANPTDRYIRAANLYASAAHGHANHYRDLFAASQWQRRRTGRL